MSTAVRSDIAAFHSALDEFLRAQRRAQGRFNNHVNATGLSYPQYLLLAPLLDAEDPLCVGQLAESAAVSAPSATRMLGGLEGRGLVARVRDEEDRRQVRIALTDEGARLAALKRERVLAARTTIFDALPPEDQANAARLLASLAAAIEELHP